MSDELLPIDLDLNLGPEPELHPNWDVIKHEIAQLIKFYEYVDSTGGSIIGLWDTMSPNMMGTIIYNTGLVRNYQEKENMISDILSNPNALDAFKNIINRFAHELGRHIELRVDHNRFDDPYVKYRIHNTTSLPDGGEELGGALEL